MLNIFFDTGKAILDGAVMYRDVMDHKGIYTYVPYVIMAFISRTSYIHINIINCIGGIVVGLYLIYILSKYDVSNKKALAIAIITVALILMRCKVFCPAPFFYCEIPLFFMIPFLLYYFDSGKFKQIIYRDWFLFGIVFGLAIATKYSLVVLYFPFWLSMVSYYVIHIKQYSVGAILKANGTAILGCICCLLPWMVYLTVYGLWRDVFTYYFGYVSAAGINPSYFIWSAVLAVLVAVYHGKYMNLVLFAMEIFMCFLATGGMKDEYTMGLLILFIPSIAIALKKYSLVPSIGCCICFGLFILYCFFICRMNYHDMCKGAFDQSVASIGDELDITNDDVMYIGENMGLGTERSKSGLYSYQWVGEKFYYSDDVRHMAQIQRDAIISHKYSTLCVNEEILNAFYGDNYIEFIESSGYVKKRDYYNYLGQKNLIYQYEGL